ncbi:MAG: outer membrane beta-barrel protein [Adhaeribacter sp.]
MINGKLSRMPMEAIYQLLSSMPANNITQIELITTPPANLDAEGNAGYINIVLRKNEADGLNGSVFLNAETRRRFSNALGTDINFRKNKFSLFANYAYTFDRRMIYAYIDRQIIRPDYSLDFRSKVSRKSGVGVHNFRMALDYQLSNRTVIGFLTTIFDRNWAQTTDIQADFEPSTGPDSLMHGQRWDKNLSEQYMGNVNLRHNFTDKQQLNLDLDYFYYHASQPQNYVFDYFTEGTLIRQNQIRIDKNTPMHIWVAKADYNWQPATGLNIETGIKATYSNFANSVFRENKNGSEWFRDPVFSEKTSMDEMIGAAFGSVTYKINQATDLKAGLRYEYTNTELLSEKAAPISRTYGSFFPVLYFSKKLNEQQTWQFSYNRRLTRPAFSELAPYVAYLDPVTYVTGNAFLWPSFTNALKTDFSHKGIIFSLQASRTKNAIYSHQPQTNAQNNIIIYSSQNIDQEDNYTFSLTLPLTITPNWEAQNNLLAMRQQVKTQIAEAPFKFARSSFSFNSSHTFKLPKMYSVELSGFYNSPTILGIKKVRAMSAINIGFRKELNNNRGRLNLSFSDIFRKNLWLWETNLPQQGLSESLTFDLDTRTLKLTYTKNFGNQKVKGAQKRTTGSAEEQKRL